MRIAATRKMAAELNKRADGIAFEYITMTPGEYRWIVNSSIFGAYDWGDYNTRTGKFRAIQASYPAEYYAAPGYLTTEDLNRLYVAGDNLESYAARVISSMEV